MIIGLRKKGFNFFIIFILLLVALPVFAAARPKWTDFCPRGLENSEYKEIQNYWPDGTKSTQVIIIGQSEEKNLREIWPNVML